jgi:hypothetical protein
MNTKTIISTFSMVLLMMLLGTPASTLADAPSTFQASDFHDFPAGAVAQPGAGTLIRTKQSIHARFALGGLDPDAAYTMWWVIWNDPSVCVANPCGLPDLGAPGNSVFYATGFVTGADGTANVSTDVNTGALPDGLHVIIPGGLASGNGFGAEIHALVQSHGGIDPGNVATQISIDGGACNLVCAIQQGIMFLPVE